MDNILFVEILANVQLHGAVEQFALLALSIATFVGVGLLASVLGAVVEVITWKEAAFDPRELSLGDGWFEVVEEEVIYLEKTVETKAIVPVRDIYLKKTAQISNRAPCVEQEWIVVEEQDRPAGQWCYVNCEETLEIPEIVNPEIAAVMAMIAELDLMIAQPSLSVNVLASLQEYADSLNAHKSDCECFTCCPFGKPFSRIDVNSWKPVHPMELARVKANTEALLAELDMNRCTPDRADAFYSHGVTALVAKAYMDEGEEQDWDWCDNQLV